MSDNTQINAMTGGDVIATADTTSINGESVSGVKVERVKVGYGEGPNHQDVGPSDPLPVSISDVADLLMMILGKLGVNDGLGRMLVNVNNTASVSAAQSGTWTFNGPVAGFNTGGYGTGLDQHYQSIQAYDAIRSKITVSP